MLRQLERNRAAAYLIVQIIFDLIFIMVARPGQSGFRPQIRNVVRAAQFEAYQVINLKIARCMVADAIFSVYLVFLAGRDVAY